MSNVFLGAFVSFSLLAVGCGAPAECAQANSLYDSTRSAVQANNYEAGSKSAGELAALLKDHGTHELSVLGSRSGRLAKDLDALTKTKDPHTQKRLASVVSSKVKGLSSGAKLAGEACGW